MPKRFIDSDLWSRDWFLALAPAEKCAFVYLTTACDAVGVWKPNYKLAEYQIGAPVDWDALRAAANGNIEVLPNGKWWLTYFCDFQYGCLRRTSKLYRTLRYQFERHGLDIAALLSRSPSVFNPLIDRLERHGKLYKETRKYVFSRDNYTCQYCGQKGGYLEMDHKIPLSRGGTNDTENLITACRKCNRTKHDKTTEEFLKWRVAV